jgi:methyl-accepting chemotaxis protein
MITLLSSPMQTAPADTVVMILARDSIAVASDMVVLAGGTAVILLTVVVLLFVRRIGRVVDELRAHARQSFGPVSDRARSISDNVEFITDALRTDVRRLNDSVKALTERLHQASDRMEERIEEFNALMEVVQSEAEDIFIDTAATVRGVRASARTIGKPRGPLPRTHPDREVAPLPPADEELPSSGDPAD